MATEAMVKLLSSSERNRLSPRKRGVEMATLRKEARSIARAYSPPENQSQGDLHTVGAKTTQRIAIPPRFRPLSVLKRDTYRLACSIRTRVELDTLCRAVVLRDEKWNYHHRPRYPTAVDWSVRLVRGALLGTAPAIGAGVPAFLFSSTLLSRLSTELNFAYRHSIDPNYVTMFIDELGGFEIISAKDAALEYDFRDEEWIWKLQSKNHPFDKLETAERRAIWARYSTRIVESDLDDDEEEEAEVRKPSLSRISDEADDWS